jgi:glycosylphosphatidylinositol transamidase
MFFNTICLVPLMERFEAEHGTLNTLALFLGRKHRITGEIVRGQVANNRAIALATIPAALYIIVDMVILRYNTAILGARYVYENIESRGSRLTRRQHLGLLASGY